MLNMNERMNESLFNLNYKIINIVRLFNFTRSAILSHNLPKLYSTGRFSWSTICYCAGGRGLKVLNGTRPVEYAHWQPLAAIGSHWQPLAAIGGHWRPLAAIGGHWRPLAAIGGHWRPLAAIGGHWRQLAAIGGHWRPLAAIGGHWRPLAAIGGHWRPLAAIGGHWRPLAAIGGHWRPLAAIGGCCVQRVIIDERHVPVSNPVLLQTLIDVE